MNEEKLKEYTSKIYSQLSQMINDDTCDNYINLEEDMEYATELIHSMSTLVPALIYNTLTGEETDLLGFNHITNRLIYQIKNES